MKEVIKVERLSKQFGDVKILQEISFSCNQSEIIGIVGRNGSGKTVLLKCICGLLHVSSGNVIVNEKNVVGRDIDIPQNMGILIEHPAFLSNLSAYDNLRILASIHKKVSDEGVRQILELFGLDWKSKKRVGKYSMGMRQRLGLAQAFMENPDIIILDEPMNGLDAEWSNWMRNFLLAQKNQGKTIILASHMKEDIEQLCNKVIQL